MLTARDASLAAAVEFLKTRPDWTSGMLERFRIAAIRQLRVEFEIEPAIREAVRCWQSEVDWAKGPRLGGWSDILLNELGDADLRGLGGAGIPAAQKWRDVRDAVRQVEIVEVAVDAQRDVEVLPERVVVVAADREHDVAAEDPEAARDDRQRAERAGCEPRDPKRALVLHGLEERKNLPWPVALDDAAASSAAAVCDPEAAPGCDSELGICEERPDSAREGLVRDQLVGVHDRHERAARIRDRRIDRIDHHVRGAFEVQRALQGCADSGDGNRL